MYPRTVLPHQIVRQHQVPVPPHHIHNICPALTSKSELYYDVNERMCSLIVFHPHHKYNTIVASHPVRGKA